MSESAHALRFRPLVHAASPGDTFPGEVPISHFHVVKPQLDLNQERNAPTEADGHPLSRFGSRLRMTVARLSGEESSAIPLGLLRAIEAASIDDEYNIGQLAQIQTSRTGSGILHGALLRVHTPMLDPFIINGRTLAGLQATLAASGAKPILTATDSDVLHLPRVPVDSASQVLRQATEARRRLDLHSYRSDDREFIDDIVTKGIKEPPIVVPTQFKTPSAGGGWVLESVDGARRTTAVHEVLGTLTESSTRLATAHWADGRGGFAIRDMTGADVLRARELLSFADAPIGGLFPDTKGTTKHDRNRIAAWRDEVASRSAAVRAFHRVRSCYAFVVLHVEAFDPEQHQHPAWHVVHDAVRQRHMPKAAQRQWNPHDVWALYALDVIDLLEHNGHLSAEQREALLNPAAVTLGDNEQRTPYRNRMVAIADFAAKTCTERYRDHTNEVLAKSQERLHTHERAQIVGAHTRLMINRQEDSIGQSIASTITSICKSRLFYLTECHPLQTMWFHVVDKDPDILYRTALDELGTKYNQTPEQRELAGEFGPHQRALGFLGGLALVLNPMLIVADENLTRTGRGGRGKRSTNIAKNEPDVLLKHMMRSREGLDELRRIYSLTINGETIDLESSESLTETRLRSEYLAVADPGVEAHQDGATAQAESTASDPFVIWEQHIRRLNVITENLLDHTETMRKHELGGDLGEHALMRVGIAADNSALLMERLSKVNSFVAEAGAFGQIAKATGGLR